MSDPTFGHHLIWLLVIRPLAASTVVLVRLPLGRLIYPLVDGERLGPRRHELHLDVGQVKGLAQVDGDVDVARVLHAELHGL